MSGIIVAALGLLISRMLPVTYTSIGSVVIENRVSPAEGAANPTVLNSAATQVDVIRSPNLIREAVRKFGLSHTWVRGHWAYSAGRGSGKVLIWLHSGSPERWKIAKSLDTRLYGNHIDGRMVHA